jgi:hypothetical protein
MNFSVFCLLLLSVRLAMAVCLVLGAVDFKTICTPQCSTALAALDFSLEAATAIEMPKIAH